MNKTEFFRYLANGGKVRMITFRGDKTTNEAVYEPRHAIKIQSNGVKFNNDSWLFKNDIDAKNMTSTITDDGLLVNIGWCEYLLVDYKG